MPHLAPATLQALADALAGGRTDRRTRHGWPARQPGRLRRVHLEALLALQGDQGARRLLQSCPVTEIQVEDPGIFHDIDTPADL
jgi:molybdenum cofactor cytidylyltransferase